ncbi:MAG: LytTR family DNA-binding domain-containing protein [Bacteroidota bacterium]
MKILIVEDELIIAKRLMRLTRSFYTQQNVSLAHVESIDEGLEFLNKNEIDLLFLDLNLNGEDGFDLLKQMSAASFHTIIISAYKEKAITAFEYGVLDFVPKPFNEKRLVQALTRIHETNKPQENHLKYLSISKKGKQMLIEIDQLLYIKGARIYTELHLKNGQSEIHNKTLDKLEQLLPSYFVRIHKSYITDMRAAKSILIESGGKYTLILNNDVQLPISRGKYKGLKEEWLS